MLEDIVLAAARVHPTFALKATKDLAGIGFQRRHNRPPLPRWKHMLGEIQHSSISRSICRMDGQGWRVCGKDAAKGGSMPR
jgi:hypothetical protein